MRSSTCVTLSCLVAVLAPGCTFTSKAKRWNDRVDLNGNPVYYETATKVGLKLLIIVPFLGDMGITGMVNDLTEDIKSSDGDNVAVVQGGSENYWYGWPPFTWVLTPVISNVAAEYRPSPDAFIKDQEELAKEDAHGKKRWFKPWSW
jgi:hypothetical protein